MFPKPRRLYYLIILLIGVLLVLPGAARAWNDDYPSPWRAPTLQDFMLDSWGYYNRECTSFVAWRLHSRNGFEMPWAIGDASNWGTWASAHGYAVNMTPAVGSVAWWNLGDHVAWVESVSTDGSSVTIEEYNYDLMGDYNERTISTGSVSGYIHFKDIIDGGSPPPSPPDIRVPVAANFDGTLGQDLLTSSKRSDSAPNLLVFPSTGSWLGANSLWSAPAAINWSQAKLTAGDLNGDGKTDLFAIQPSDLNNANSAPDIYWLQSTGSSFASPQLVGVPSLIFNDVKEWVSGDFNGDGKADLLAVSKRSDAAPNLVVFPSTGSWLGGAELWSAPSGIDWSTVVIVPTDLNGDGKTDLLAIQPPDPSHLDGNPYIYWLESMGSSFATPQLVGVPGLTFSNINAWLGGDFNGDGYGDLFASSQRSDSAPNLLVWTSSGTWLNSDSAWSAPGSISWANAKWVPADLDGDGKTDLLAIQPSDLNNLNSAPNIYWIRSLGSSFATPQLVGVPSLVFSDQHWQS